MNFSRYLSIPVLLVFCSLLRPIDIQAQNEVIAQIIVPQPVPVSVPELLGRTGETVLVLTNLNPLKTYDVMIGATLSGNNGIRGSLNPLNKKPSRPITLKPGQPVMLSGDELLSIFSNYDIFDIEYEGIELEDLVQNPLFPEGYYTACVTVYDYDTGEKLSAPQPMNCSPPITVRTPDPPIIQFPLNNSQVEYSPLIPITFRWTPVKQMGVMFYYQIRIVEVPKGVNPYDAIESENFLFYSEKDLTTNILLYDLTKPPLPAGTYAVQVTAYDPMGQAFVKNEGKSNVHVFNIVPAELDPPVILEPAAQQVLPFSTPMNVAFTWTAPANVSETVFYRLRVAEVPTDVEPEKAILHTAYLIFEKDGLKENEFVVNSDAFAPGKTYVARVQAWTETGQTRFGNDGYSPLRVFSTGVPGGGGPNDDDDNDNTDIIASTDFPCGQGCTPSALENQMPGGSLQPGQQVKIGHFIMQVSTVAGSPGNYQGTGVMLPTDFFPTHLGVRFSGLSVNSSREALAGRADVNYAPNAPPSDWLYSPGEVDDQQQYRNYIENNAPGFWELTPSALTGVPLPLKVGTADKYFVLNKGRFTPEGAFFDLAVMMPLQGDQFEGEKVAYFGAQNVCFSPGGIGVGMETLRLDLLKKFEFSPTDDYYLSLSAGQGGNSPSYARIDCDGVSSIHLEGRAIFSRNKIIPIVNGEPSNKRLAGSFTADVVNYSDILGTITFQSGAAFPGSGINDFVLTDRFYLKYLMHYSFQINTATWDLSDVSNPPNMVLPQGMQPVDETWRGIYASDFSVYLPRWMKKASALQNEQASFSGDFFMLEPVGVSFGGEGNDVIPQGRGSLGGWSFFIDHFAFGMAYNTLNRLEFTGGISLPVSDGYVAYEASGMRHNLSFITYELHARNLEEVRIPMWYSTLNLDPNSFIDLEIDYGTVANGPALPNSGNNNLPGAPFNFYDDEDLEIKLNAHLSGQMHLDNTLGQVKNVNIHHLRVENLQVRNHSNYLSSGPIDFVTNLGIPLDDLRLLGFDLPLDADLQVSIDSLGPLMSQLSIRGKLKFDAMAIGLRAEAAIGLRGQMFLWPAQRWAEKDVILEDAMVDFSTSSFRVQGRVRGFYDDPVYGDGYRGSVSAYFYGEEELGGELFEGMFGTKKVNNRQRRYWYVRTGNVLSFTGEPIPLFTPNFGLYGISVGAYYNMVKRESTGSNRPLHSPEFVPDNANRRQYGFFGNALVGTIVPGASQIGGSDLMNGNVELRMVFNHNWSFSRVDLEGELFLMRELPSVNASSNAASEGNVKLDGILTYDHDAGAMSGNFGYELQIPGFESERSRQRIAELYFGNNRYYINLGTPTDPIQLPFGNQISLLGSTVDIGLDVSTYLCLGYRNPALANFPPRLPQVVLDACRSCRNMDRSEGMSEVRNGTGVAMGFHALFDPPPFRGVLDLGWAGKYGFTFEMEAAAGVDFGVVNMEGYTCNGSNDFGIYNFYGRGRGYLHGGASLDYVIFGERYRGIRMTVGAVLNLAGPNPLGARADLYARLSVGPFGVRFNERVNLGTMCEFASDPEDNLEELRSRVASLNLINSVNFEAGSRHPYSGAFKPTIEFAIRPNEVFTESYGGTTVRYRARLDGVSIKKLERNRVIIVPNVPHELSRKVLYFDVEAPSQMLEPNSTYQVSFRLTLEISENGDTWQTVRDDEGIPVVLRFSRRFYTERPPTRIENPLWLTPRWQQRYFHWADVDEGRVVAREYGIFSYWWDPAEFKVVARFTDLRSGTTRTVDVNVSGNSFSFPVSHLSGGKLYKLELLVVFRNPAFNSWEHELYSYVFQTSKYATMQAKLDAMTLDRMEEHWYTTRRSGETISSDDFTLIFRNDEGIEEYEWESLLFVFNSQIRNSTTRDWILYRIDINNTARRHGTGFPSEEEFIGEPTGTLVEGPLYYLPNFGLPPLPDRRERDVLKIRWRPDKRVFYTKQRVKGIVPIENLTPAELMLIRGRYRLMPRDIYRIRLQYGNPEEVDAPILARKGFDVNLNGL